MTEAQMIADTLEVAEQFASDKDIQFLESVQRRAAEGRKLTPPQLKWLEDLHSRACRWESNQ